MMMCFIQMQEKSHGCTRAETMYMKSKASCVKKVRIERMVSELQVCVKYVSHVCKYVTIYIMTQCSLVPSCHGVQ